MLETDEIHCSNENCSTDEGQPMPLCPSVVERYFTKGYAVNLSKGWQKSESEKTATNFNDVCVLRHSNRLCIVTLAPSHPVIAKREVSQVANISFKVTDKLDRTENQVSGKRKRGAHWLNATSGLCIVTCADGSKHTVYSGIRGSLVEMNKRLLTEPSILQSSYQTEGFIAIIMPKIAEASMILDGLLNKVEYDEYVKKATESASNEVIKDNL